MAFNLGNRFPLEQEPFPLLDPGTYTTGKIIKFKQNKAPFLSSAQRKTLDTRIYTEAIYDANISKKIPNGTSLMSKTPRFPYEALSKEDIDELLCKCGIDDTCECTSNELATGGDYEECCQGKVLRRLYKGPPPRGLFGQGLSAPSKTDRGFEIASDGSAKRIRVILKNNPPIYDTRVNELSAFYRGCKWSHWTSKRDETQNGPMPGPADYTIEKEQTPEQLCVEQFKSDRRKHSKQLRYIEMVQQRNIREGQPGPATYNVKLSKGTDLQFLGTKAQRFQKKIYDIPGPADYYIKSRFDPSQPPISPCHAKLPGPSCFGVNALRFKPHKDGGPGPAAYLPNNKCKIINCTTAPFGSFTARFKNELLNENSSEEDDECNGETEIPKTCTNPTWTFKSRTKRMKPLLKKLNEASPSDVPQTRLKAPRSNRLQYIAPFYTSEGRFRPWNDWLPIYGRLTTPGPGYYDTSKPRHDSAVWHGPLFRSARYLSTPSSNPAPTDYKVGGDLAESVLATFNDKLKKNVVDRNKFRWEPPVDSRQFSFEEREALLLKKAISLLNEHDGSSRKQIKEKQVTDELPESIKPKLLRCYLHSREIAPCI